MGQILTTSDGTWLNSPASFAYQWEDCDSTGANCSPISGATFSTYAIQASDIGHTLRSVVVGSTLDGSGSATSSATGVVTLPRAPTAAFGYSPGTPMTGQSVAFNASASSCADAPCTYTWADDPPSGGSWALGSGPTISFTFNVAGTKYVTLTVADAANRTATVEHDVVVTPAVGAPQNTALPQITGTAQQGQSLSVSTGTWSGSPTSYAYQWQDCDSSGANCVNISGATTSSYSPGSADVGQTIRAVVTASNSSGSTPATSSQTAVVAGSPGGGSAPSNTTLPIVTGSTTQGSVLSTTSGSWNGSPTSYTYAWQDCDASGSNCASINGATAGNYTLTSSDVGHTIRSVVTAHNSSGASSASSAPTSVVAAAGSMTCNLNATPATFSSQVSAAAPGQTVCLASGNYGTWTGVNKAITLTAASGAAPQMVIAFSSGVGGFTLDHMTNLSGTIYGGSNITIQNSTFTDASCTIGCLDIEGSMSNIVLNRDTFSYAVQSSSGGGPNSKLFLDTTGSSPGSAVTVENSYFANGDLDGIHFGGGSGDLIENNFFTNFCDRNVNHTDNMQFEGGSEIDVVGNYIYTPGPESSTGCVAGGIDSYDGGTDGVLIENNVVDTTRDWGIELYSDQSSIVEHNTVVYHPKSYSAFNSGDGQIDIDRKSQDPAGSGTHVYDNVATVDFTNGSTGTADHNTDPSTVSYASACSSGCTYGSSTVHDNYLLAAGSPGTGAADDGTNTGIYAAGW